MALPFGDTRYKDVANRLVASPALPIDKKTAFDAGGSGAGGGDRCPSGEKGTTPVGRRCKKPSAFHRAALCYLEKRI